MDMNSDQAMQTVGEREMTAELVTETMEVCGRHYAAVTGTNPEHWDLERVRDGVMIALDAVPLSKREAYPEALEEYLCTHRSRLEELWRVYGPEGFFSGPIQLVYHLVESPEAFALCERIEGIWYDSEAMVQRWAEATGEVTPMERLTEAWLYGTTRTSK